MWIDDFYKWSENKKEDFSNLIEDLKKEVESLYPYIISIPYPNHRKMFDNIEIKYNDPNGNLKNILEKNWIIITKENFFIWKEKLELTWDNILIELSVLNNNNIKLILHKKFWIEWAISYWTQKLEYTISNWKIISKKFI